MSEKEIPFGKPGWKPVQGTNMKYLTMFTPRSTASIYTRLYDVQYAPPIGGKFTDKARDRKSAGYKISTFYAPEAKRRNLMGKQYPWLVEVWKVVVMGSITSRGRLPKGFKPYKHFETLDDAKDYVWKIRHNISRG